MMLSPVSRCLEGGIPATLATSAADGTPNVAPIWQAHQIDDRHIALAHQFFNKTCANLAENPHATLLLTDPESGQQWALSVVYHASQTDGPVFRTVQGRLASIAARAGMGNVYALSSVDIFEVVELTCCTPVSAPPPDAAVHHLAAVKALCRQLAGADDLAKMLDQTLSGMARHFGMEQGLILCMDESSQWLYTVASHGYDEAGVGSEVRMAEGIIGIAAQLRTPIRLSYLGAAHRYGQAMRVQAVSSGLLAIDAEIRPPGLPDPQCQMAVPIEAGDWLAGVLYVESARARRYTQDDEDALVVIAHQLGLAMRLLLQPPDVMPIAEGRAAEPVGTSPQAAVNVRYFAATQSVFLDEAYLIKGVAGAILWLLLLDYTQHGRIDFSNRELRLDSRLKLPEIDDNLETRLLLLERRLAGQCPWLRLEKVGRGRFRLCVDQPIQLTDMEQSPVRLTVHEHVVP